jgi:hypothetical protein
LMRYSFSFGHSSSPPETLNRSFPDERRLGPRPRLRRMIVPPRKNGCNNFPQRAPPVADPSQPAPSGHYATPSLSS